MARFRIGYIVFLLGCLIFSIAYQSRIASIMLTAAIVYPIFAAALTAISLFLLNVEFDEKRAVHEKNEQFELPVQIRNKFLFPYAPAALECIVPDVDTGLFLKKQIFASIAPLKHMRIFLPCMHRYRGAYPAKIMKLSVFDPLRIIRFSQNDRT